LYDRAVANARARKVGQIVNGALATAAEFPWQVSLGTAGESDAHYAHFCGGAVYKADWIITAAHCVEHLVPGDVKIAAGATKLDRTTPRYIVDRIVPQPGFSTFSDGKDVALLHLQSALPMSTAIQPIALVTDAVEASFVSKTTPLTATGWGAEETGGLTLSDLMKVGLPYVANTTCAGPLSYPPDDATHKSAILPDMICAGYTDGHADICEGDSGGPLIVGSGHKAALVGVASFTAGCAAPYKYAVFARASHFRTWIETVTQH
jgi:trypsin